MSHPGRHADRYAGPPALAAEVRSPSTWRYDVGTKKRSYERQGISYPVAAGFDVALELVAGEVLSTPLLPELGLDLAAVFDR